MRLYFVNQFKDSKEEGFSLIYIWFGKYGFDITLCNLTIGAHYGSY